MQTPDPTRPALCLSDMHLTDPDSAAFSTFAALLQSAAERGDNIFLLGDLCEVWVGDDDDGPLAHAFRTLLTTLSKHTWIGLMHGNRDFLFADQFASNTGVTLLPDPFRFGDRILLSHGDQYCVDDADYQRVRAMLRSPEWQQSVMAQTLTERRALAADLRRQSASANANKAQNIMDVNAQAVAAAMHSQQCQLLIHGHTHRPAWHRGESFDRLVLGDWEATAWVAQLEADVSLAATPTSALRERIALQCLPLTPARG